MGKTKNILKEAAKEKFALGDWTRKEIGKGRFIIEEALETGASSERDTKIHFLKETKIKEFWEYDDLASLIHSGELESIIHKEADWFMSQYKGIHIASIADDAFLRKEHSISTETFQLPIQGYIFDEEFLSLKYIILHGYAGKDIAYPDKLKGRASLIGLLTELHKDKKITLTAINIFEAFNVVLGLNTDHHHINNIICNLLEIIPEPQILNEILEDYAKRRLNIMLEKIKNEFSYDDMVIYKSTLKNNLRAKIEKLSITDDSEISRKYKETYGTYILAASGPSVTLETGKTLIQFALEVAESAKLGKLILNRPDFARKQVGDLSHTARLKYRGIIVESAEDKKNKDRQDLDRAQTIFDTYGPNIRIVGDKTLIQSVLEDLKCKELGKKIINHNDFHLADILELSQATKITYRDIIDEAKQNRIQRWCSDFNELGTTFGMGRH
jgi:hypothetical protein